MEGVSKKIPEKMPARSQLIRKYRFMPATVVKHSKRVMQITEFLTKQFATDDFFVEGKMNAKFLTEASYLHDLGKLNIPKEFLYKDLCNGPSDLHKYLEHTTEGIKMVEFLNSESFIKKHPNSLTTYIYQIIKYHHANEDEFPVSAMIVYVADSIDHECFKTASEVNGSLTDENFPVIIKKLLTDFQRKKINSEIIERLSEESVQESLKEFLNTIYRRSTSRTHYGIKMVQNPVYDLYKIGDAIIDSSNIAIEDHELFGHVITYNLNSRYYGKVKHKEFAYIANKTKQATKLDGFFLDHLKEELATNQFYNSDLIYFINISINNLNKSFTKKIVKLITDNNLQFENVALLFELLDSGFTELQIELLKELKMAGIKLAINNTRSELINAFKEVNIDYAFYDNYSTEEVDKMFVDLLQSLGTVIVQTDHYVDQHRYAVKGETEFKEILRPKAKG